VEPIQIIKETTRGEGRRNTLFTWQLGEGEEQEKKNEARQVCGCGKKGPHVGE